MFFSNHWRQRSKTIFNNSTKSVILLSYTDVEDKFDFQKQSLDVFKKKAVVNFIPSTNRFRREASV